jgi:hypothetical protein
VELTSLEEAGILSIDFNTEEVLLMEIVNKELKLYPYVQVLQEHLEVVEVDDDI